MEQGAVTCGAGGLKGDGQGCGASATDLCVQGFTCVNTSSTTGQCLEFCSTDAQCTSPGGLCIITLDNGVGGEIAGVKLCTPNCNPITNVGCPTGSKCEIGQEAAGQMRLLTFCTEVGPGTQFSFCDPAGNDCAPGYTCVDDGLGYSCLKYCNLAAPSCSALTTCLSLGITLGNVSYGVCD